MTARTVIPAPTPLTWTVHSRNGITAEAWPINQRSPRLARTEGCRHRVKGPPGMTDHPRAILVSDYREGPFPVLLGNPDASEVEATGGRPHIDITIAADLAVRTDDVGYIDDLIEVLERGRARLVMWRQDHKQQREAGA